MKTKPTPGPYRFAEKYGNRPKWEIIVGSNGDAVCRVYQDLESLSPDRLTGQGKVNAELILAALNKKET